MMTEKRFVLTENGDKKSVQEISLNGSVWQEYTTVEKLVDKLNEQYETIQMWVKSSSKITKLLEENTKPTAYDGGDVYLNIGEDKRCKYERTTICNNCTYFSSYFLDCRLMMEDDQYKKALSLGLVKE